jgi:hypothetical protein
MRPNHSWKASWMAHTLSVSNGLHQALHLHPSAYRHLLLQSPQRPSRPSRHIPVLHLTLPLLQHQDKQHHHDFRPCMEAQMFMDKHPETRSDLIPNVPIPRSQIQASRSQCPTLRSHHLRYIILAPLRCHRSTHMASITILRFSFLPSPFIPTRALAPPLALIETSLTS